MKRRINKTKILTLNKSPPPKKVKIPLSMLRVGQLLLGMDPDLE